MNLAIIFVLLLKTCLKLSRTPREYQNFEIEWKISNHKERTKMTSMDIAKISKEKLINATQ